MEVVPIDNALPMIVHRVSKSDNDNKDQRRGEWL